MNEVEPSVSGARTARPAARAHDIDWAAAANAVRWLPAEHRRPDVDETTALRVLRCTEESFRRLLDIGLPYEDGPDGRRYDLFDLKNAGLWSGSGVTEVEVAMRFLLGHMSQSVDELTAARYWQYRLTVVADPTTGIRSVFRPVPEIAGGAVESWECADGVPHVDGDLVRVPAGSIVTGRLTTRGAARPVLNPAIRRAMLDLTESGVRWHYLPRSFEQHPYDALALGIGTCSVLCNVLVDALRAEGFDATAYHGWLIAVSQIDHGWVEVVDDDGIVRCLDPSMALLATQNGFGSGAYYDFVIGSRSNRIVPTRSFLDEPFLVDARPGEVVTLSCTLDDKPAYPVRRLPWQAPVGAS